LGLAEDVKVLFKSLPFQITLLNEITTDIVKEIYKYIAEHGMFSDDVTCEFQCVGRNNKYMLYYDIGRSVFDCTAVSHIDLSREDCVAVRNHGLLMLQKSAGEISALAKEDAVCYKILYPLIEDRFEKFDGSGFPSYKSGNAISLSARVLAVSEFLAKALFNCVQKDVVATQIREASGNDFDPAICDVVLALFDKIYDTEREVLELSDDEKSVFLEYEEIRNTEDDSLYTYFVEMQLDDKNLGVVTRAAYTPVAEKTNRIFDITKVMIEEVFEKASMLRFSDSEFRGTFMLPISVGCLTKKVFIQYVKRMIYKYKVNPEMFIIAVTETVLGYGEPAVCETLTELRRMGMRIAIDNFGSEFSSLTRLDDFDFDIVKIDRLFIEKVHLNNKSYEIVRSVIQFADSLGLTVIADGVDSLAQKEALTELGCKYMQGVEVSKKGLLKIEMLTEVETA